jgi:hypothetical protein
MVPAGLPGVDYASEVFEPNLLRFNSSRSLGVQEGDALGSIELVEIRLESDAEVEAARKSGELDDRDGQRLLVSTIRPDVVLRDRNAGYAFRKVHQMALAFGYKRAEGVATGRPNEIVATLRAKSQVREWPLEMDLSASWTMPAGMEAAR